MLDLFYHISYQRYDAFSSHIYRPRRSFGLGNIFTSVCQEFCPQGGGYLTRHPPPGPRPPPPREQQTPEYGHRSAGTHPTGMHSCFLYNLP